MDWVPLRTRKEYRKLKDAVSDRLDEYWVYVCDTDTPLNQIIESDEQITLTSFRLLKYIRSEIGNINEIVPKHKLDEIDGQLEQAIYAFYSLTESDKTSFQEESDILEILSRTAYKAMKDGIRRKDLIDEEEMWR